MTKDKKRHGAKIDYIGLKALGRPARFSLEAEEIVALLRSKN